MSMGNLKAAEAKAPPLGAPPCERQKPVPGGWPGESASADLCTGSWSKCLVLLLFLSMCQTGEGNRAASDIGSLVSDTCV